MASRLIVALLFAFLAVCYGADPVITGVTPSKLKTIEPTSIQISGTDLPVGVDSVWISGIECEGAGVSGGVISCDAAPGLGKGNKLTVIYDTNKQIHGVVDFLAAEDVELCPDQDNEYFVGKGEAIQITICGKNFGLGSETHEVVGWSGKFSVEVQGVPSDIDDHFDNKITITLPQGPVGRDNKVYIKLGSQTVNVHNVKVHYPGPIVNGITNRPGPAARAIVVASTRVAIFGRNFGIPSPFIVLTAHVGQFPCTSILHVSDTELHCTVYNGFGANRDVVVTVNGQSSTTEAGVGGSGVRYDFPDVVIPGFDCTPPFGSTDIFNTELCNCWSGSAPANNLLSKDCSKHAVCPGRLTTQPVVAQHAPSRPQTEFKDDKLYIKQTSPIVKNRRDSVIQFVIPALTGSYVPNTPAGTIGSSTCFYPGRIWEKRLNELDCLDEFYGALPWSQNELCGFVEDTAAVLANRIFKTNLVTSYVETFKKSDGSIHFRKISNSFLITVTFARQIVALTTTPVTAIIADEDAPTSMDIVVNGDALYDVASKNTIISFTTTMAWPYQIDDVTLSGTWKLSMDNTETGLVDAIAILNPTQPGELECDQVQDTECEQAWILTIDTLVGAGPQVCNLKGIIEFSTDPLLCRDYTTVDDCQGAPATNFTIQIGRTDLCDSAPDVDASAGINGVLESFYDEDLTIPQAVFQTGDMVFFKLTITDPVSSIDRITFAEVVVRSSSDVSINDELYEQTTPGDPVDTSSTFLTAAHFNITQEFRTPILYAKSKGELLFHFRLLRDVLNVVADLSSLTASDMTKQLTVEVTVDVAYHGNTKRSTVATTLPTTAHSQLTFYDLGDNVEEMQPHANDAIVEDDIFSGYFSPASTVVASVLAVAGAAALVLA